MTRKKRNRQSSFTTFDGILLTVAIGALVSLIFLLVYYVYVVPVGKSLD